MSAGAAPARATTLGPVTSLAAARAHARALPFADDADDVLGMMADIWPVHVAAGPVHAPALDVDAILVVTGDLIVDGLIADVPSDHGAMLMVLGDLRARDLLFHGPIFVGGALSVSGTTFLASSGDWALMVGGDAGGGALVEYDHALDVRGARRWQRTYRRGQDPSLLVADEFLFPDPVRRRVEGVVREVTEWRIDPAPLEDALRAGRAVVRPLG